MKPIIRQTLKTLALIFLSKTFLLVAPLVILPSCHRTDYQEEDVVKTEWDSEKGKVVKKTAKSAKWKLKQPKNTSDYPLSLKI